MTGPQTSSPRVLELIRDGISSAREWLLIILMLAVVFLAILALDAFPSLERDPRPAYLVAGAVFLIAFAILAGMRHRLMPWGSRARSFMWGGLAAIASVIAFGSWGLISYANGALDRGEPDLVPFSIVGRTKYRSTFLVQVRADSTTQRRLPNTLSVEVEQSDWESAEAGSSLLIDLRAGFFHIPWVAGYRLCDAAAADCPSTLLRNSTDSTPP